MSFRFIIDLAFFVATIAAVTAGGRAALINLSEYVQKETLTKVQTGLPRLEPFARRLTGWEKE